MSTSEIQPDETQAGAQEPSEQEPSGEDRGRAARRWALLAETARRFAASLDEASVIQTVVEGASTVLAGVAILTFLQPDGALQIAGLYHPDAAIVALSRAAFRTTLPRAGLGIMGMVAQTGTAHLAFAGDHLSKEQRVYIDADAVRATLSAPLLARGGLLGVLTVTQLEGMSPPTLNAEDLDLAQALAAQAALAIENARLFGRSQRDRALYRAAIRSAAAAIVIYDFDRRVIDANDAFLLIVRRERAQIVGQVLTDVFPSLLTRGRSILAAADRVLAGRRLSLQEVPVDTARGRTYWDVEHDPVLDADGHVLAGLAALRDATRRVDGRQRLQVLTRSVQQRATELDAILSADPGALALLRGPRLIYSFANQRYCELFPVTPPALDGQPFEQLSPFRHSSLAEAPIEAVWQTGISRRYDDVALNAADGSRRNYSVQFVPVAAESEEERGVLIVGWETTVQAEALRRVESLAREMAARSSELRAIIDAMVEGVYVCDTNGQYTLVNAAGARLAGLPVDEALTLLPAYVARSAVRYPDGRPIPQEETPLAQALRGQVGAGWEQLITRPDTGEDMLLRVAFAPIRDASSNAILGAVAVVSDITELRRLERQREEFLSVASHELHTPIASVKGYAQMLLRSQQRQSLSPERLSHTLQTIDHETNRLVTLVADLLDVSNIRTGRLRLHLRRLDLAELAVTLLDRFATRLPDGFQLVRELTAEPLWVEGDGERLRQILENLLDNAVKYAPNGGVLRVRVARAGTMAEVVVTDQGIGIPEGGEKLLFEPYARAANAPLRRFAGLGLGLYISRTLAERHGGTLTASSSGEGLGATFTLRLPLDEATPAAESSALLN